jgi:hypothetical protein
MSNKRSDAERKKTLSKRKKEKEKRPIKPPQPDPNRTNAKLAHVNNAANFILQQHGNLEKRVTDNVKQLWDNQSEISKGMDAAEFNLRAHQKVLNSLAIEFERLVTHLNDEVFKTEHELAVLELAEVTIPSDTGEAVRVVRRLDWPYYHTQVDKEMRALKEAEELRAAEEEQQRLELAEEKIEEAPMPPQDNIPEGATVFGG